MLLVVTIRRSAAALMVLSAAGALGAQTPSARTLDTVAIVASRTRLPDSARSIQVITRDEIARSAARTVADVLASVMSVDVYGRSAAQADVSIRGSSTEQVVVLVDGVRMTDVQSAHYTLDLAVPLASVERIEVLRGTGSALYGPDAVGGVIEIVTGRPRATVASVRSGSFGTVGGAISSGMARGSLALGATADFDKADGHRDGTDYRNGQGRLSLASPLAGGTFVTNAALGIRDFGSADFYGPYNSVERTSTTTLDSRWTRAVGAWTLGVSASTRRHHDHYVLVRDDPSLYENRHLSWQTGGEVVARRDVGPVALALGADAAHDQLSSARLGGHRDWRTALFADAAVRRSATTAHVGLRGDHSSVYGEFFSPSLSASTLVTRWLRVHSNGGFGFRAPTWTERFYVDPSNQGDPDLRPERFWTGDFGMRASGNRLAFDATVFARRATRLIDWVKPADAPNAVWRTMNVEAATYRGLETALDFPSVGGVTTSLFGSWLALRSSDGGRWLGKYALRPIVQQAGLRVASPTGHAFSARVDLAQAKRVTEDAYFTGDARLAWERRALRFTLDVRNLTDAEWLDASGKPAAGRGVYVGVDWRR